MHDLPDGLNARCDHFSELCNPKACIVRVTMTSSMRRTFGVVNGRELPKRSDNLTLYDNILNTKFDGCVSKKAIQKLHFR